MFALDLFNTDHERRIAEGAVDQLEQRRIDDLAMKMDDLVARAKDPAYKKNPAALAALMKEFQKCKAERDSYYMVRNETMGYGTLTGEGQVTPTATGLRHHANPGNYGGYEPEPELKSLNKTLTKNLEKGMGVEFKRAKKFGGNIEVDEAGIGQDVVNKTEKMARATPSTPTGKVASTVKNAAKWLAGKGGPGKEGPTYEGQNDAWQKETPWKQIPKAKSGRPVDPRGEVTHLSDVARREAERKAQDQKKNPKEVAEHGGGIGPKQHWQDLMQERKLSVGDPVVVTAPNEFEGKTGEIHELSPSGKFIIVNLYNHGKHSMHLSDVEYNEYADDQEQDDWYDEGMEEGYASTIGINPPALDPVSQWKINVRQLIADYIKDPQALYRMAKQKGSNSAEAMAYKFIMHPKGKIDLPPDAVTFEGWSDAMVSQRTGQPRTPYSVYIKGKKWKDFENDDHAEAVANKLRAKFKAEGRDPSVITIAPTDYDKKSVNELDVNTLKSYADKRGAQVAAMKVDNPNPQAGSPEWIKAAVPGIQVARAKQKIARKERQAGVTEDTGSWIVYDPETRQIKKRFKTHTAGKSYARTHGLGFASSEFYFDRVKDNKEVAEGAMSNLHAELSDVYNRMAPGIERHRDSFKAGQLYDALEAVAEQHGAEAEFKRMMAGARNRAHMEYDTNPGGFQNWFWFLPFDDEELSEEQDTSAVERAILNRIMVAHTDLLMKFGPEKVMQAAEEVAYNVGDVDEIGTSDVSAYVHQVKQILGVPEEVNEKWSQKYKSSINCANPKGFSQKAHCAGRKK